MLYLQKSQHKMNDIISQSFSVTSPGPTPWLYLFGQESCSITFSSIGGGCTVVVQGSSDPTPTTATTITSVGSSGYLTNPASNTSYGGSIVPYALTGIRLYFTSITSGTVSGDLTCSTAIIPSSSGNSTNTYNSVFVDYGGTANPTNLNHATTSFVLLNSNPSRRAFYISNNSSTATCYLGFGFTPTTSYYTYSLAPMASFTPDPITYTGAINAISSVASGNIIVTEITP